MITCTMIASAILFYLSESAFTMMAGEKVTFRDARGWLIGAAFFRFGYTLAAVGIYKANL